MEPSPPAAPMESPPREIELKLEFEPAYLDEILRHPVLRRGTRGRATTKTVRSVYYDTPDLALYRRGIVLRVRDAAQGCVQTVKTLGGSSAGLFDRPEDEAPVPGAEPDVGAIGDASLRASVLEETLQRGVGLEAVVETETRRTARVLARDDTEVECVVDVGEVRTRLGVEPLHEVELELRRGDAARLFELAYELQDSVPLLPARLSKPEKGFARLTGLLPAPRKATALGLRSDASVEDLLDGMFASCLEQIEANRAPANAGDDPEGVHQLRVGARRLRSGISLFRAYLPEVLVDGLREELRWLGRELGPARDLDVFLLETLEPLMLRRQGDGPLKRLRDEAVAARAEAYEQARNALASARYGQLITALGACRENRSWRQQVLSERSARLFSPARELGSELIARRHRRVRRSGRSLTGKSIAELHALRIQMKKLRYAVDLHRELFPERRVATYLSSTSRLQDVLGHLNDVAVAELVLDRLLARLGSEVRGEHLRAAGFVLGWAEHVAEAKMRRLGRRWKAFKRTPVFWDTAGE